MTDRENFIATVEHRRPERILYHADFVEDLRRRLVERIGTADIAAHYGYAGWATVGPRRPPGMPKPDYARYWDGEKLPQGTTFNDCGVAMVPSGFYHFWKYVSPLRNAKSLRDIEEFPLDDAALLDASHMAVETAAAQAAGKIVTGWIGHMYETAWQVRGYEEFLIDTIERPSWAECLLERLFEQNLVRARAAARAGVDRITCGDDVANQKSLMFSKATWQRLIHSRWTNVWVEVKAINPHARIHYHSDGNIVDIVGELVDAGVDILNPLQPECLDVDAVHRRHGRQVTFDGTIGTQSTMPFGTAAEVRARVRDVIERYGRDGGLIVSPTHVLEPDVPLENIEVFFEACRTYGALG